MTAFFCNYATREFRKSQNFQSKVAKDLGFQNVIPYSFETLDPRFIADNQETFNFSRGGGYWIWKTEVILRTAEQAKEGDLILYLDSGILPLVEAKTFEIVASDGKLHLWQEKSLKPLLNSNWIDLKVAEQIGLTAENLNSPHMLGGIICFRKNPTNLKLLMKWQQLCLQPSLLRPDSYPGYAPSKGLIWHRHDQSLLNLLALSEREFFSLHLNVDLDKDMYGQPNLFFIHRRRSMTSKTKLSIFVTSRFAKRILLKCLPARLQDFLKSYLINGFRRKSMTKGERQAHKSW